VSDAAVRPLSLALSVALALVLAVQLIGSGEPTSPGPSGALAAPASQLGGPIVIPEAGNQTCLGASLILGIDPPLLAVADQTNTVSGQNDYIVMGDGFTIEVTLSANQTLLSFEVTSGTPLGVSTRSS
jgi:hypothetical protein